MSPPALFRELSRRDLLCWCGGLTMAALISPRVQAAETEEVQRTLSAGLGQVGLIGKGYPDTAVWCYDGRVPGPELRARQGERLRIAVSNGLPEETTVHWHGIRLQHAMDGVPHLTQKPISPGETFIYEFDLPDAGTYWYHPHQRSSEQVGRGLYGPLIVEEAESIEVDRDIAWVLDDWRLTKQAEITSDFGDMMDASHNGQVGNTVTINGKVTDSVPVRSNERLRLRLINAANARIFGLRFEQHDPLVIALDGHAVEPHAPPKGRVTLAPAQRADLLLDMTGKPGDRMRVVDDFYEDLAYQLVELAYDDSSPVREQPLKTLARLPGPQLPEPQLEHAVRHQVTLSGGMMGMMMGAMVHGRMMGMRSMMRQGMVWAINNMAAQGHVMDPIFSLKRNQTCLITMANETAWHHPMHLHGHVFRVLSRNREPTRYREWQDTVLVAPRETVEIAFVADNPGNWMFHCHILEHQAAGMMSLIRVD